MKNLQKLFSANSKGTPSLLSTYDCIITKRSINIDGVYGLMVSLSNAPTESMARAIAGITRGENARYSQEAIQPVVELVTGRVLVSSGDANIYAMQYSNNGRVHIFCTANRSTRPHNKHRVDLEMVLWLGDLPDQFKHVIAKEFPYCTILGAVPSDGLLACMAMEHRSVTIALQSQLK